MARARPSVFVGSSTEGLKIARALQVLLDHACEVTIWSQGVFGLSQGTLESLVRALDRYDFAILVLTADDLVTSREASSSAPRDNVLFELGLFMGGLGRERTSIVYDRTAHLKLPSDLAGVSAATFEPHASGNLQSALGAAATQVEDQIVRLGVRDRDRFKQLSEAAQAFDSAAISVVSPTGTAHSPVVDRGTVLQAASGKSYRVSSAFYGGANATLYRAGEPGGNAVIAKVYWRGLAPNSPPWELFQQELRTAEILTHRNIVRTLDRGLRAGYPFTIIEYLGGGTLRDWLRTHDRLPGHDILSIASQVADAIDYAHSRGVIHRDVKPGNVLFESDPNGRVALSDFGVAAILGAVERDITAVGGEFAGSPGYLAPELIEGAPPTRQADLYSFGVVLFEMISKVVPFDDNREVLAIIRAKVDHDAPDIRTFRPDVPVEIATRLAGVLARAPSQRPTSAHAVLAGLDERIRGL